MRKTLYGVSIVAMGRRASLRRLFHRHVRLMIMLGAAGRFAVTGAPYLSHPLAFIETATLAYLVNGQMGQSVVEFMVGKSSLIAGELVRVGDGLDVKIGKSILTLKF